MTLNEYQTSALRTANTDDCEKLLLNGILGLNGEAGECADLIKKSAFQGHTLDKTELAKELGDVLWYVAITAQSIGFSLEDIGIMNIEKLYKRYPRGFDENKSINRME